MKSVFFSNELAVVFQARLAENNRFCEQIKMFNGSISMACQDSALIAIIRCGEIQVAAANAEADFGFKGQRSAWEELLSDSNASLTRLVRRGDLKIVGNRILLMKWWKLAFLGVETMRGLWKSESQ